MSLRGVSLTVEQGRWSPSSARTARARRPPCDRSPGLTPAQVRLGHVRWAGHNRPPAHEIIGSGIALARRAATSSRGCRSTRTSSWAPSAARRRGIARTSTACSTLFPRLEGARRQKAGTHVGRRAADAGDGPRAHGPPQLLMLDEPSMGLAPILVQRIFETIAEINRQGVPSSWSSRTQTMRSTSPSGATCWRRGRWR